MMLLAKFCIVISARCTGNLCEIYPKISLHSKPRVRMGPELSAQATSRVPSDNPWCRRWRPGRFCDKCRFSGFVHLLKCLIGFETKVCKIFLVILYVIYLCVYTHIYSFIYLGFSFAIVFFVCYLLCYDLYVYFIVYDYVHAFVGD